MLNIPVMAVRTARQRDKRSEVHNSITPPSFAMWAETEIKADYECRSSPSALPGGGKVTTVSGGGESGTITGGRMLIGVLDCSAAAGKLPGLTVATVAGM